MGWRVIAEKQEMRMSRPHSPVPQVKPAFNLNPGDEAAPGTPGTGEAVCPDCGGSGKIVRGIGGG